MSRILYVVQFFSTEEQAGGQGYRHYRHACALAQEGHRVVVITSGTTTMDMNQQTSLQLDEETLQNLQLIQIESKPLLKKCVLNRAIKYFEFSAKALFKGFKASKACGFGFDYVLGSSPPILIGLVAFLLSLLNRAHFQFEVRDLWSKTMAANGLIKSQLAIQLNRILETFLYKAAHQIIILSQSFRTDIQNQVKGLRAPISFVPNGADFHLLPAVQPVKQMKSLVMLTPSPPKLFRVVYAGVFSDYTHLQSLLAVARKLQENPYIQFHLIGGGYQFPMLKKLAEEWKLTNVTFEGTQTKKEVLHSLTKSDLSIICYRNLDLFGEVLPNKLFDYLAASSPILACVKEGEISRILEESGAGHTVAPEDVHGIAAQIQWFFENRALGVQMGQRGHVYALKHFNRDQLIDDFLSLFPCQPVVSEPMADTSDVIDFQDLAKADIIPMYASRNSQ